MSSQETMDFAPVEPPQPIAITHSNDMMIRLDHLVSDQQRAAMIGLLDRIHADGHERFASAMGMEKDDVRLPMLAWKRVPAGGEREYELRLQGNAVPGDLQIGQQPELTMRLRLGSRTGHLTYGFRCTALDTEAEAVRNEIRQREVKAVTQPVNAVLAMAVAQVLYQHVHQQQRLQQTQFAHLQQQVVQAPQMRMQINARITY